LPLLRNFADSAKKLKSNFGYSRVETVEISESNSSSFGENLNLPGGRLRLETVREVRSFFRPEQHFFKLQNFGTPITYVVIYEYKPISDYLSISSCNLRCNLHTGINCATFGGIINSVGNIHRRAYRLYCAGKLNGG